MTFNFDDIIDATTKSNGGANIVAEQHDVNGITIEQGAIDSAMRGGNGKVTTDSGRSVAAWDASEYGISAAEVSRQLAEADTPEARAKVMDDLRQRAIDRADLATSGGRVMLAYAGDVAWHGLGVQLDGLMTLEQAMELSGLGGWSIEKMEQSIDFQGERILTGAYAIVRTDCTPPVVFGTVGNRYEIIPNESAFDFMDSLGADVRYESAGAIDGGAKCWLLSDIPGSRFEAVPGDEVGTKLMATTTHDGSGAIVFTATSERAICANTHRLALRKGTSIGSIRHTRSAHDRLKLAEANLDESIRKSTDFADTAQQMARTEFGLPKTYFHNVLDCVLDTTIADVDCTQANIGTGKVLAAICEMQDRGERAKAESQYRRHEKRRENLLDDVMNRFESETCQGSTAWSAWNAVTETVDHGDMLRYKGSERKRAESRFESLTDGRGAEIKEQALEMVLEMASA